MKKIFKLFIFLIILLIILIYLVFSWVEKNLNFKNFLESDFAKKQVENILKTEIDEELYKVLPKVLGFDSPKTYLLLFNNDTELRPGGGFIGSYGILKMDKGKLEIIKLEGTEVLDKKTPDDWRPVAPSILSKELGVDRWYFRDSNWSPDFSVSAQKALELYIGEGGEESENIDAVFAISTKVLEEILAIVGEVEVDSLVFNSENITEKLQYEVEYGFSDKDIHFIDRKNILKDLAKVILEKVKIDIFLNLSDYKNLLEKMIREKHFLAYFINPDLLILENHSGYDFYGKVKDVDHDYLLWVDANLAALKTDRVLERKIIYKIEKNETGNYIAKVKMIYNHKGIFDWRTTRYRTYARIFVPKSSELLAINSNYDLEKLNYDEGEELNKKWFAYFFVIEPGQSKELEFEYLISENISQMIEEGNYTLLVQKQINTVSHDLTLDLNFDKNILSANPAEKEEYWFDGKFYLESDLLVDREVQVDLEK